MATLFFKFVTSSAMLIGIYWLMLRNKASYKANRIFLMAIPAISILMSTLSFEVYTSNTQIAMDNVLPRITIEQRTQLNNSRETGEEFAAEAQPVIPETAYTQSTTKINWGKYTCIAVISVSAILVLMALYYIIKIIRIRSRMKS